MTLTTYALAALACGVGSVLRYLLSSLTSKGQFPWPTIVVNIVGSVLLGALAQITFVGTADPAWFLILGLGFAGGLTTFSSLAIDVIVLWRDDRKRATVVYLGVTYVAGLAASAAGWAAASLWVG